MKQLFFAYATLLAMVCIGFSSCSSDDDEESGVGSVSTLYGTWQYVRGYAVEDGEKHHEKSISSDDAGYLHFENYSSDVCIVFGDKNGLYYGNSGDSFPFVFDQEEKTLKLGSYTYEVQTLTGNTLELRYYYNGKYTRSSYADGDYESATYQKVSDKVLLDKFGVK